MDSTQIRDELQARIDAAAAMARRVSRPLLSEGDRAALIERIKGQLKRQDAVLVAHYYVDGELQDLADDTAGIVSDSLETARFGYEHSATTVVKSPA
jgi:quinolinate synthase